eukprot:4870106-Pyramimonas_sp.AAC.1
MSRQMRILAVVGRQIVRTSFTPAVRTAGLRQTPCRLSEREYLSPQQSLRSFVSLRNLGFAQSGTGDSEHKPETAAEGAEAAADAPEEGADEKDKLLAEKEQENHVQMLLTVRHIFGSRLASVVIVQVKDLNDRLLRSYAEMENVRTRMMRQADDAKKFAIQ